MATSINFLDPRTGVLTPEVFADTNIVASSRGPATLDFTVEYGFARSFEPEGIAVAGHLISLNLDPVPLEMEIRRRRGVEHVALPPNGFFLQPAGVPMTIRNRRAVWFCAFELPPAWLEASLGRDLPIEPRHDLVDDQLQTLTRMFQQDLATGTNPDPLYAESLGIAFACRLRRVLGAGEPPPARGMTHARLKRVREYVEEHLADRIRVDELAAIVELSVAHFARAFRNATGYTPHAFVMARRLARARRLLVAGEAPALVAVRAGFADQAHLARSFRQRFGITPGELQRHARGPQGGSKP